MRNGVGQAHYSLWRIHSCLVFYTYIMQIGELFQFKRINEAFYKCKKASGRKVATQNYYNRFALENIKLMDDLLNHRYRISPMQRFTIDERGKKRNIEAPAMRDRIVQKILCEDVLVPQLTPKLIYDNYASIKNRGTSMARKRIENDLYSIGRKLDYDFDGRGYVLLIDIRKYFDNIDHSILKSMLDKDLVVEEDVRQLIYYLIDSMSKFNGKGLNIGSELPQILAVYYLHRIDNYIKCVKGFKYYGRYMDDFRIIDESKERLTQLLDELKPQIKSLNLGINEKKTQIIPLKHGFTYLQTNYKFKKCNGAWVLTKSPTKNKISRERKRLRGHKRICDKGAKDYDEIASWYKAWVRSIGADYNNNYVIKNMNNFFRYVFKDIEKR